MRDHEVVDLLELRAIVEGAAAGLASARMTDEQLRTPLQRLEELDSTPTADTLLKADIAFHASIAAGAGNIALGVARHTFLARTYRARHLNAALRLEEALVRSRGSHRRIYDAVVARDAEAARASATAHVETGHAARSPASSRLADTSGRPQTAGHARPSTDAGATAQTSGHITVELLPGADTRAIT